ncbi:MAG: hypothetical protein WA417_06465 [Stellaceae bacterium]|jgi:hypothetical protein
MGLSKLLDGDWRAAANLLTKSVATLKGSSRKAIGSQVAIFFLEQTVISHEVPFTCCFHFEPVVLNYRLDR